MASIPRRLLLQSRQCPSRIRCRASPKHTARSIATTTPRLAKQPKQDGPSSPVPPAAPTEQVGAVANKAKDHVSQDMSEEEATAAQLARLVADLKALDPDIVADAVRKGKHGIPLGDEFKLEDDEHFAIEEEDKRKVAAGFWAEGEESMGADEDYFGDDVTSHGHKELAQHRQLREYSRLIAWEMPLLSQLAKPFTPPTPATPFRFRYTSYLNESHPAANKVVVEFDPTDLALPPAAVTKLIKLAGPRYNPSKSLIKLACEKFTTQAQNKRFLGETIASILAEAKDTTDTFADVPLDFRHHRVKKRHEFPKEWAMTAERRAQLDAKRQESRRIEDEKRNNGMLVDGKTVIDTSLPFMTGGEQAEEVLVGAGARGKLLR
ncbi:mitochondrial ribosomal subunit protein-domain-containing protein [Phaeosphaeria sp. MPI-PUGE-AT-0046c]|nr:mitochondrial ribosomal subunit protein-domain-containing protein [Phaeosphaeria sp. MPI-PUGE-AT-0046c]